VWGRVSRVLSRESGVECLRRKEDEGVVVTQEDDDRYDIEHRAGPDPALAGQEPLACTEELTASVELNRGCVKGGLLGGLA
jgi:hypothetical protein